MRQWRDMGATAAVGTSGWSYGHWTNVLYPDKLKGRHQLEIYAQRLPTVEINSTFYRLPRVSTTERWRDLVPPSFLFAIKASRLITHQKRLADCEEALAEFAQRLEPLRTKACAVLWQLPPSFRRNDDVFSGGFCSILPEGWRHALEVRHTSWLCDEVYERLAERDIALVWVSSGEFPQVTQSTARWAYLRFHGLSSTYRHDYTEEEMKPWADRVAEAVARGCDAFCYFNNDAEGHAVRNALTFTDMLRARGVYMLEPECRSLLCAT